MLQNIEVIILAGGLGTRLRSVVNEVPKCMAPVAGKPFLWYLLRYLSRYDVKRVILSVGYLREVIFKWIDEVKDDFKFEIDYAIEEIPLGTGGGIKLALEKCTAESVVILNGDTFFDVTLEELFDRHKASSSSITLALKPMCNFNRYGNVQMRESDNLILAFEEKKQCDNGLINGGVYLINRHADLFSGLPEKFSFEVDVLQPQCANNALYGTVQDGYFIDIGIPKDYARANDEFKNLF